VEPVLSGPTSISAGAQVSYSILTVPGASGYDGRSGQIQTDLATHGAENGLTGVTVQAPDGYDIISTDVLASGTGSFHLTHPDFTDQVITLDQEYLIGSRSQLEFKSRLGWATTGQAAVVEVSNDEGLAWQEVYRQIGTSTSGEQTFVSHAIDLSAFADHLIKVRFAYRYTMGQAAYTQTDQGMGWYIDDISFKDTGALVNFSLTQGLPGPSFPFTAPENGTYILQARGTGWGGYPFEWGPVLQVTSLFIDTTGDLNGDERLSLADAILGMRIVSGLGSANLSTLFDVDRDGRTGLNEVAYILQRLSEAR
jgi:hypothetical protein